MAFKSCFIIITAYFALGFSFTEQAQLPKYLEKCKLSSPKLDECLTTNGQRVLNHTVEGIPEFDFAPFVPPEIKDLKYAVSNMLHFDFTKMRLEVPGLTKVNYVKLDQKKKKLTYSYVNSGTLYSDYGAKGRLIIIPLNVHGQSVIKLINMNYVFKLYYEPETRENGKVYWKIVRNKVSYDIDRMEFKFTNLITDEISQAVSDFTNDNWKEIFDEVGGPIMKWTVAGAVSDVTKIFDRLSMDELFDH